MLGILVTLLLYFCLISWIAYRKKGSEEDYYQVKKAVPVTVLAFSVFATLLSPISFLTLVGNAYIGRSYLWFAQCGIFLAIPLAPPLLFAPLSKGKLRDSLSSFRRQVSIVWYSLTGLRSFHPLPVGANSGCDLLVVSGPRALYPY